MTISAKVILGSEYFKNKITTFELTYPRFIHAEMMTHRVFSRNAASSRAIPVFKMLKNIWSDMAYPIHWGANQSGMQAKTELIPIKRKFAKSLWGIAGITALLFAWGMNKLGAHKQIVNRIVEPWSHITIILTTTDLDNFFELRDHPDAQPEIQELAKKMKEAIASYNYKKLRLDEWHLPYVTEDEKRKHSLLRCIQVSVARCARVSYLTHDGNLSTFDKDVKLYDRLVGSVPLHASPAEHQASPVAHNGELRYQGNLKGFKQFRKILEEKMTGSKSPVVNSVFAYK